MTDYFCSEALLADGWATNVLVRVDDNGVIAGIAPDTDIKTLDSSHLGERSNPVTHLAGTVLPAMINLHSHAHQRAMAGLAEHPGNTPDSFWSWREIMYRAVDRIAPDHLQTIATQLYSEMLLAGYSHVCEFQYLHHDINGAAYNTAAQMSLSCVNAARETGIGLTILPVFYAWGGFGRAPALAQQRRFVSDLDTFHSIVDQLDSSTRSDRNINVGIAPHSLRACDQDSLQSLIGIADSGQSDAVRPIHIHIAEQQQEVDDCVQQHGARPVQWLYDNINVDQRWCLIHATHTDDEELRSIAVSGAVVGLCPTTEASLGDGIFNATGFNQFNGRFGIGSDSQISVSPVEELRWLEYVQRLTWRQRNLMVANDRSQSTGRYIYEQAINGGQQAAGTNAGVIETGNRADFIMLDDQHPLLHGRSRDAIIDSYLFSGNSQLIHSVIVSGDLVVSEGTGRNTDERAHAYRHTIDELNLATAT